MARPPSAPARVTEADIERQINDGLQWTPGVFALQTVEHRKRCRVCGTFSREGSGVDRGIPDRLLRVERETILQGVVLHPYPPGVLLGIETKRPEGWSWSSEEQRVNWERGVVLKAHGWDDIAEHLIETERRMNEDRLEQLREIEERQREALIEQGLSEEEVKAAMEPLVSFHEGVRESKDSHG